MSSFDTPPPLSADPDVEEAAREGVKLLNDYVGLDSDAYAQDLRLLSFNRMRSDWIARFEHPDWPYLELWVQKQNTQIHSKIFKMDIQETHPRTKRDDPIPGL